jgi:hypothetical protein
MSQYPDSFRVNCVGTLPCNNNKQFCDHSKGPVVIQNGAVVSEERSSEKLNKIDNSSTTHCQSYGTPQRVIQDNEIKEKPNWTHTWSNVRGYGNIVVATNDSCNNVHGRVHPYNRITKLSMPYDGPAVVKDAWKMNKAEHLKEK